MKYHPFVPLIVERYGKARTSFYGLLLVIFLGLAGADTIYTQGAILGLEQQYNARWILSYQIKPAQASIEAQGGTVVMARVTEYGETGHRMANGEWPHIGAVATSDRSIPLGTKVMIGTQKYVVKDRTAQWVHEKFSLPTIDIYSENPSGVKYIPVTIK